MHAERQEHITLTSLAEISSELKEGKGRAEIPSSMNLLILTNFVNVFNDVLVVMHETFKRVGISF